jgi:hypothetical protein
MPKHALITLKVKEPFAQEVIEGPHQDAGQDGRPFISLTAPDGRVLKVTPEGDHQWGDPGSVPGAWEQFIAVPGAYVVLREHYTGLIPRGGPWDQPS